MLKDKSEQTYTSTSNVLNTLCLKIDSNFKPNIIYIDFEKAIHNSITCIWPNISIRGCQFHLGQAWWRKIQSLGLASQYSNDDLIRQYLTYIFGLSFLNPAEVEDMFSMGLAAIQPLDDKITQFSDYLVDTYISEDSIIPPHVWVEKVPAFIAQPMHANPSITNLIVILSLRILI